REQSCQNVDTVGCNRDYDEHASIVLLPRPAAGSSSEHYTSRNQIRNQRNRGDDRDNDKVAMSNVSEFVREDSLNLILVEPLQQSLMHSEGRAVLGPAEDKRVWSWVR